LFAYYQNKGIVIGQSLVIYFVGGGESKWSS
ncbi:MAG: hypothetical protein ACJA2O_001556, partial [Candidatus Azotimanducaceae bacterium]